MTSCLLRITGLPMTREPDREDGRHTIRCEDPFLALEKVAMRIGMPADVPGQAEKFAAVMAKREVNQRR